jgi:SMI1 / KNR4 family (SUKH-1)
MMHEIEDWPSKITKAVTLRQQLEAADRERLFEYPLPEAGAIEDDLRTTERELGFPLDPRYRRFLRHANGWRAFVQATDLFGTDQLRGAFPMELAREMIAAVDDDLIKEHTGFDLGGVLPIGASDENTRMWLLGVPGSHRAGQVLDFMGSDFMMYPDFDEFFLAMLDDNRLELERLQPEGNP